MEVNLLVYQKVDKKKVFDPNQQLQEHQVFHQFHKNCMY